MDRVRAKFRCSSVTPGGDPRQYVFGAVYDTSTPENQRFATATPFGELKMTVDNPAVRFEVGQTYYLDFTEAPA